MWLELTTLDGPLLVSSDQIAAIRPAFGKSHAQSIVYLAGQPAVDGGFLVTESYRDLRHRLREVRLREAEELIRAAEAADEADEAESEERLDEANER